jgi:hypothetical protein
VIALVSCVARKHAVPCAARDLYVSPLFRAARRYAEAHAERWFILSAEHGLVLPDEPLDPYDLTLNTMAREHRKRWADRVLERADTLLPPRSTIALMAGRRYREFLLEPLAHRGHVVEPLPTWRLGIGA